jgi:hypothetical protein
MFSEMWDKINISTFVTFSTINFYVDMYVDYATNASFLIFSVYHSSIILPFKLYSLHTESAVK